jgi:rhodanese-related sulfurtransferase
MLTGLGLDAYALKGGFGAWVGAGYPVEKGAAAK